MEVGILFKIGAVGILVSVLCQVLKHSGREEQAFLASIRLSASVGGVFSDGDSLDEAVSKADKLMYQAKTKKDTVVTDGHESVVGEPQKQEILIVDDSNINREILSEMLGNEYIIHEAASGEECIDLLNQYGTEIGRAHV